MKEKIFIQNSTKFTRNDRMAAGLLKNSLQRNLKIYERKYDSVTQK